MCSSPNIKIQFPFPSWKSDYLGSETLVEGHEEDPGLWADTSDVFSYGKSPDPWNYQTFSLLVGPCLVGPACLSWRLVALGMEYLSLKQRLDKI